tara:strand:+ start:968 stop:1108 length:141 start_codon:yes stop_codon:yes gene_type:complete
MGSYLIRVESLFTLLSKVGAHELLKVEVGELITLTQLEKLPQLSVS